MAFKENFHTKLVTDIHWNCDGQFIGSASFDKTVKIGQFDNTGNVRAVQTSNLYDLFYWCLFNRY